MVFVRDAIMAHLSGEIFTAALRGSGQGPRDCDLGGIVERRIEQMTNPLTSMLPAFLTPEPGLNSGFMIRSNAARDSENRHWLHAFRRFDFTSGIRKIRLDGMAARRLGRMLVICGIDRYRLL